MNTRIAANTLLAAAVLQFVAAGWAWGGESDSSHIVGPDGQLRKTEVLLELRQTYCNRSVASVGSDFCVGSEAVVVCEARNMGHDTILFPVADIFSSSAGVRSDLRALHLESSCVAGPRQDTPPGNAGTISCFRLPPGDKLKFALSFVPLAAGEYAVTVSLSNDLRTHWVMKSEPLEGHPGSYTYGSREVPLEGAWTGRRTVTTKVRVDDELSFEDRTFLGQLREITLSSKNRLSDRIDAVATLEGMKHVFATRLLLELESRTHGQPALHAAIVRALYDLLRSGTGYLAAERMKEIALNGQMSAAERLLAVEFLSVMLREREIRAGGKFLRAVARPKLYARGIEVSAEPLEGFLLHRITSAERAMARDCLEQVASMQDAEASTLVRRAKEALGSLPGRETR